MSNISISIGGKFLKLPEKYSITWEENHPSFFDLLDEGEHTLPVEFDAVDENPETLGYTNVMQTLDLKLEHEDVVIFLGSNPFKYGKLIVDRITHEKISGSIKTGLSALAVLDMKLSELALGGVRTIGADTDEIIAHAKACAEDTYPNKDYTFFPVYNPDYYGTGDGSVNPGFSGFINAWNATLGTPTFAKNIIPDSQADEIFINSHSLVPFPYYKYIIKQITAEAGLTADGSFMSDAKTDKLVMYSNYDLVRFQPKYNIKASPVEVVNMGGFTRIPCPDDHDNDNYDPDDAWQSGDLPYYIIGTAGLHEVKVKFTPIYPGEPYNVQMKIKRGTQTLILWQSAFPPLTFTTSHPFYLNFSFWASAAHIGQDVEVLVNVVDASGNNIPFQNSADQELTWVQISTPTKSKLNVFATEIDLKNHVADMTCREFLTRIKEQWCLTTTVDSHTNKLNLSYTDDLFLQTPKVVDGKDVPGFAFNSDKSTAVRAIKFEWPSDDDNVQEEINFLVPEENQIIGEYNTYSDIPAPQEEGKYALVKNLNKYFRSTYNQTFVWSPYSDNYYEYVFDPKAEQEILCKAPPLMMTRTKSVDFSDGKLIVPYIRQPGSSPLFGLPVKPTSLRSCYYHGFYHNENAVDYPFASPHAITAEGGATAAIIAIIHTEDNLLDKFLRWVAILNAPGYYIKEFDFNILDKQNLKVTDLLFFRSMKFFMRKLSHTFEPDKKVNSEAEIIRIG